METGERAFSTGPQGVLLLNSPNGEVVGVSSLPLCFDDSEDAGVLLPTWVGGVCVVTIRLVDFIVALVRFPERVDIEEEVASPFVVVAIIFDVLPVVVVLLAIAEDDSSISVDVAGNVVLTDDVSIESRIEDAARVEE
jgi:hypothetical protein